MLIEDNALIPIHKPLYYTSFDVIRYLKKHYGIKKIGHSGTLDPLAQGLLIICTGKRTKDISQFMDLDKEYDMELTLGAITASYDLECPPECFQPYEHLDIAHITEVVQSFQGKIWQQPPLFSAVKKDGKPLYAYARKGIAIEVKAREVTLHSLHIATPICLPKIRIQVHCDKGVYIRSLANDIGNKLGCGAYLSALTRTRIGHFHLKDALNILPPKTAFFSRKN